MCELASEFSETRIHANLCELKREPLLVSFTENPVKIQSELKREPLLADGTKDNRLKIWENRLKKFIVKLLTDCYASV